MTTPAHERAGGRGDGSALVKRAGLAAFLFFLIKGLLWLAVPALLYLMG